MKEIHIKKKKLSEIILFSLQNLIRLCFFVFFGLLEFNKEIIFLHFNAKLFNEANLFREMNSCMVIWKIKEINKKIECFLQKQAS